MRRGLFLDLLRTVAAGIGDLLIAADLWPVLILAGAFGLLLLQLTVLTVVVSSLSQRLNQVGRHLRELSKVVQGQARAIEQLSKSQKAALAVAPRVYPPAEIAEHQIPDSVQSADDPIDVQGALGEVMLAETSKIH